MFLKNMLVLIPGLRIAADLPSLASYFFEGKDLLAVLEEWRSQEALLFSSIGRSLIGLDFLVGFEGFMSQLLARGITIDLAAAARCREA
jgi:hypothetical protein